MKAVGGRAGVWSRLAGTPQQREIDRSSRRLVMQAMIDANKRARLKDSIAKSWKTPGGRGQLGRFAARSAVQLAPLVAGVAVAGLVAKKGMQML